MIEAEHSIVIDSDINQVWDYVQDIRKWAMLFPGCKDCDVIDENNSKWLIKVGAGGLIKTINVLVNVSEWQGPERVNFNFKLESEPVEGSGSYRATSQADGNTAIQLQIKVTGSGQMAPMWEAMSKPLLPQMAKTFSSKLKIEIEQSATVQAKGKPALFEQFSRYLRGIWLALSGADNTNTEQTSLARALKENKATVLKFIHAMSCSDASSADECLAPNAFTVAKGYGKFSGVRQRDVMVGTISAFKQLLPTGLNLDVKSATAEADRVVVEFEGNAKTADGSSYHNQYCMVFTLSGGKISQVNEYFCNIHADEVLWPLINREGTTESIQT